MRGALRGDRVVLRPATEADAARFAEILREPSVAAWWGEYDLDRVREELGDDDVGMFAIELAGEVVGLLELWEEDEPDYRHAGLDIAIAGAHQGRGLGQEVLNLAIDHLIADRGHHRITIDPAAANERAIRCYERVGFKRVGILRRYERLRGRTEWRDGLLMDLLADERPA